MNDSQVSDQNPDKVSHEEIMSALFAQMVVQQSNMALMLLGKVPHPQTGKTVLDVDAARMFIDQLEMLEFKTQGNLTKEEQQLLKHSLMTLRMAFVDAVNAAPAQSTSQEAAPSTSAAETSGASESADASAAAAEESKKKFSKKY
jgi:hypothetical protein